MRFILLVLFLPFFSNAQFSAQEIKRFQARAKNVTIIRDQWDVPHIYGRTDADVVFGLMYAQCEENFTRVERNYLEIMGRLGEVEGKSMLLQDLQMRLIYDSSAAIRDYQKAPAWLRKLLEAFSDGVNFYLHRNPKVQPLCLNKFEPWFPLMYTDGSISPTQYGGLTLQDTREAYFPIDEKTSYHQVSPAQVESEPGGSNGFALSPAKSHSGNAILYINPHVTFYFRSEVHLVSEEGLNAYGAVTWGQFFVYQGFNEFCGWMHTSSYADVADLFIEEIEETGNQVSCLYDGKKLAVNTRNINIRVREGDSLVHKAFKTWVTPHGPVMGKRNGDWLSLKENNRSMDALMQSWLRTKAKGFEEFKKIMNLKANNSNNTVFADNKGNIAYWHGNFIPRRDRGIDYSLPVDGRVSTTNWRGVHTLDEIVHLYNPSSGWIQNCNSTPYTAAGISSPDRKNYPSYMAPDGQNFRALNAIRLLSRPGKFSMDQLISEVGYNHYLTAFDSLLPPLFNAFEKLGLTDPIRIKLSDAIHLLQAWDRSSSASSSAASLAIEWGYRLLPRATRASNPYLTTHQVRQIKSALDNTPDEILLGLLQETMADLEKRFGNWNTAWGDINRYQRIAGGRFSDSLWSIPVGLAAATWGALPSYVSSRLPHTNRRYGTSGNSFIACVEFGKKLKARTVITGGQSFDPASPHFTDQASRYIDGEFKDVLFYKEDVLKNSRRTYHPGE